MRVTHARLVLLMALTVGCGPGSATDAGESETGQQSGETGQDWEDGRTLVGTWMPTQSRRAEIIMVVDDSPSMRGHLPTMVNNVGAFAQVLSAENIHIDARIVVTTTSVPGPTCSGSRAIGGAPVLDSCLEHLEDFVGLDEHGEYGATNEDLASVCESFCSLPSIERVPSRAFEDDPALAVRPWIEPPHNSFGGNLPDDAPFEQALGCALLQGFSGCRFESPIEAAARIVERSHDPSDPLYGFRREDSGLLIVIISDEDDCSHPDSSAGIFDANGERVFWPDGAGEPLSAICVNASLECDANGCELIDHALSGAPTNDPAAAVLTAPARLLDALQAAGEYALADWTPAISVLGGFTDAGNIHYEQPEPGSEDQPYADAFGIGPGCTAPGPVRAAPGTRLATLTDDDRYSICGYDWTPVLTPIASSVLPGIQPACMPDACITDLEPATELLEPDCVVERVDGEDLSISIPMCERDANGWLLDEQTNEYLIPPGEDHCWVWLTDSTGTTASPYDDMSPECIEAGRPGEYRISRRAGSIPPHGYYYRVRCRPCA